MSRNIAKSIKADIRTASAMVGAMRKSYTSEHKTSTCKAARKVTLRYHGLFQRAEVDEIVGRVFNAEMNVRRFAARLSFNEAVQSVERGDGQQYPDFIAHCAKLVRTTLVNRVMNSSPA